MNQHFLIGSMVIFIPRILESFLGVMSHDTHFYREVKDSISHWLNDLGAGADGTESMPGGGVKISLDISFWTDIPI